MKTFVRVYDKDTGKIEDRSFKTTEDAFAAYWELSEKSPPSISIELISDNKG